MKIVIIGNSAAGFSCAENLISAGQSEITVISKENYPVYKRDSLVDYLAGKATEKEIFLQPEDFYSRNKINFLKNSEVIKVDTKKQRLVFKDNCKINFDYLVIASGAKIDLPDLPGKNKQGIMAFYSLDDVKKIKEKLFIADTVCLIGNAVPSLALVEFFLSQNKEVKIIAQSQDADVPAAEKLELISLAQPVEFIGESLELQAVKLSNGKVIGASFAIFVGPRVPSVNFLKDVEITMDQKYISVDADMRTSIENIFACGSVVGPKSWAEATQEGIMAGQGMLKSIERGKALCQTY